MASYRQKMDFLSSSSEEEEDFASTKNDSFDLDDSSSSSSSGDEMNNPRQNRKKTIQISTAGISTGLSRVKIDNDSDTSTPVYTSIGKSSGLREGGFLNDDSSSSSDDDSFLGHYKPAFKTTPRKPTVASASSDSDDSVVTARKNRTKWRRSVLSKEYSMTDESVSGTPSFRIPASLFDKMYPFQRDGVSWMVGLHAEGIGGLLADDMGMGKTYQTLAFLGGMMRAGTINNALIVAPLSVLPSWKKEASSVLMACVPNASVEIINSECCESTRQRLWCSALECTRNQPHLVITTYGLLKSFVQGESSTEHGWDYMVLDEAQKIKNSKTQAATITRRIAEFGKNTRRLIVTGTPIMNNLSELWSLMDFACGGRVLGSESSFKNQFQLPIEAARDKDSAESQIEKGKEAAKNLQDILKPYLLQRQKIDFLKGKLPNKKDFVVWTHLSDKQRSLYSAYVEAKDGAVMDTILGVKSSPLVALSWLKKLIGHPVLVSEEEDKQGLISAAAPCSLLRDSVKLQIATDLVYQFSQKGHKTLIFSQSTKSLDILQRVLEGNLVLGRVDGQVTGKHRQHVVDRFNERGSAINVMLISTGAGGVGLTLNAADRVILYDPAWNPASDSQAVDRCYRIGQMKDVFVYRLIAAGTIEEKIYDKQIHKDGIRRAVTSDVEQAIERHYNRHDLRQLFKLGDAGTCDFLDRLLEANGRTGGENSGVAHRGIVGISSHDMMYDDELNAGAMDSKGAEPKENPFSSPTKNLKVREATVVAEDPEQIRPIIGKSQRVLQKYSVGTRNVDEKIPLKREVAKQQQRLVFKNQEFDSLINKCDRLVTLGRLEDAMEDMMNGFDSCYENFDQQQKMKLHSKIASVASQLGWI